MDQIPNKRTFFKTIHSQNNVLLIKCNKKKEGHQSMP